MAYKRMVIYLTYNVLLRAESGGGETTENGMMWAVEFLWLTRCFSRWKLVGLLWLNRSSSRWKLRQ